MLFKAIWAHVYTNGHGNIENVVKSITLLSYPKIALYTLSIALSTHVKYKKTTRSKYAKIALPALKTQ
jgi:hypothetical protein